MRRQRSPNGLPGVMGLVFLAGLLIFGLTIFSEIAKFSIRQGQGAGPGQPVQPLNSVFEGVGQAIGSVAQILAFFAVLVVGGAVLGLVGFLLFKVIAGPGRERLEARIPYQMSTAELRPYA